MATAKKHDKIVKEIVAKYGSVIDLQKSPQVIVEIVRKYGSVFNDDGTGGVSPSSIAVAGPPSGEVQVQNNDLLREILTLKKQLKALSKAAK